MIRSMSVYSTTSEKVNGAVWAKRYPEKANELWVVAQSGGKKKKKRIGPPTEVNRARAERKRAEWLALLESKRDELDTLVAPTFRELSGVFVQRGLPRRARSGFGISSTAYQRRRRF